MRHLFAGKCARRSKEGIGEFYRFILGLGWRPKAAAAYKDNSDQ
jgi:hypothetical protein